MFGVNLEILKYYLLFYTFHNVSGNYFCNFSCKREHTACRREPCYINLNICGRSAKPLNFRDEDKEWMVELHNKYRNKIALGEDTTGGNGEASNMQALSYDRELEFVSQCWSNACAGKGNKRDTCRTTNKFEYVGQNIYAWRAEYKWDFRRREYLVKAVDAWYSEINMSNAALIDSFQM